MEWVLDVLREIRGGMEYFSRMRVLGVPVDWFFHLVFAAAIAWGASRLLPLRRVVLLAVALIVGKELFDIFAKTRVEYIRPPGADLALDITAGLAGLALGCWLARRFPLRRRGGPAQDRTSDRTSDREVTP
ncbi:MAG: hypothetical protein Q7W56_09035 [Candidatus Latescibacteria bacterium]|nr:hypothetical protein [Candidatus Latescibacterota bacterium]